MSGFVCTSRKNNESKLDQLLADYVKREENISESIENQKSQINNQKIADPISTPLMESQSGTGAEDSGGPRGAVVDAPLGAKQSR